MRLTISTLWRNAASVSSRYWTEFSGLQVRQLTLILSTLDCILLFTGKPYHPNCFTCVVCTKSLDGIPFTVDASNQIHCIEDFHRRFAPRCSVCRQPIMPTKGQEETVRVVALDRSFHVDCYRCVDCNLLLSSEEEGRGCYPLDNDVLCKGCNTRRIQALTSRISAN